MKKILLKSIFNLQNVPKGVRAAIYYLIFFRMWCSLLAIILFIGTYSNFLPSSISIIVGRMAMILCVGLLIWSLIQSLIINSLKSGNSWSRISFLVIFGILPVVSELITFYNGRGSITIIDCIYGILTFPTCYLLFNKESSDWFKISNYKTGKDWLDVENQGIRPNKFTREEAIEKLKKSKEHLELELITQDDYDKLKNELSPIIMSSSDEKLETNRPDSQQSSKWISTIYSLLWKIVISVFILWLIGSESSSKKSSSTSSYQEVSFVGKYVGNNNYGLESIISVRSNGKYTMICRDMDSYIDGQWKKESSSRIAFYADNGFGGMDKTLSARISSTGLQVDGGNFFRRK